MHGLRFIVISIDNRNKFFFSSRRRHTRLQGDWSSDVCSADLDLSGADRGLRDAIASGLTAGPTLQISVTLICQTGGHGDVYLSGAGLERTHLPAYPGRPPYLADGPDEMRRVVRGNLRAGADWRSEEHTSEL